MMLEYKKGEFLLSADMNPDPHLWLPKNKNLFTTSNLKAAAKFISYSNDTAQKVFKQRLNQFYQIPLQPQSLSFLDSHQIEGIKWILSRKRSYLAHTPGAGKTAQAIIASHICGGRALFIVPPSLALNWGREIEKFYELMNVWPPTVAIVPLSDKYESMNWNADIIICPDSMLTKIWVYKELQDIKFKFLSVDEASRFKESGAKRSLALFGGSGFRGLYQTVRHVVLLDGSPMPNRPMELWAPVFALDPQAIDYMDQHDFGFRYCGARINDFGKWEFKYSSNEEELKEKLQKSFMHVVTEKSLTHPERKRSLLYINKDTRTREMRAWEQKNLHKLTPEDVAAIGDHDDGGQIAQYRRELGISKIPFIAQYIQERMQFKNESILLFAWHREVCEDLHQRLSSFKPGLIMGGVSHDVREKVFQEFQAGTRRLIIGNIAAMGRGHNLQKADRVVFGEYSWTDELNKQCEKRASRKGRQTSSEVRCDYLVVPNSMDEKILKAVFAKEQRVRRIVG